MRNINKLSNIELYNLVNRSLKNMSYMGLIFDEDVEKDENYSLLSMNEYFDIDSL